MLVSNPRIGDDELSTPFWLANIAKIVANITNLHVVKSSNTNLLFLGWDWEWCRKERMEIWLVWCQKTSISSISLFYMDTRVKKKKRDDEEWGKRVQIKGPSRADRVFRKKKKKRNIYHIYCPNSSCFRSIHHSFSLNMR